MIDLYNTTEEISTRVLFIFARLGKIDEQKLGCIDFMTIYASKYVSGAINLHPDNPNSYMEYISLVPAYKKSINELILKGLINLIPTTKGFIYAPSKAAKLFVENFNCEYIKNYKKNLDKVIEAYATYSSVKLMKKINQVSVTRC